jgi:hypothetical protein
VNWTNQMQPLPAPSGRAFNHVIGYLPDFDVFLNPTDGFARFEDLDMLLSGKMAVLATESGEVRQTPASKPGNNLYRLEAQMALAADGSITGKSVAEFSPRTGSEIRRRIAGSDVHPNLMLAETPEGGFGRLDLLTQLRDLTRPFRLDAHWISPQAVAMNDQAYFFVPIGIDFQSPFGMRDYLSAGTRRFPLLVGVRDSRWQYEVDLPDGYSLADVPADVAFDNAAGRYQARYELAEGALKVERQFVLNQDVYGPDQFSAFQDVVYALLGDVRRTLVLTRAPSSADNAEAAQ